MPKAFCLSQLRSKINCKTKNFCFFFGGGGFGGGGVGGDGQACYANEKNSLFLFFSLFSPLYFVVFVKKNQENVQKLRTTFPLFFLFESSQSIFRIFKVKL